MSQLLIFVSSSEFWREKDQIRRDKYAVKPFYKSVGINYRAKSKTN